MLFSLSLSSHHNSLFFFNTHNTMPIIMSSKRVRRRLRRRLRRPNFHTAAFGKEAAHHFPLSFPPLFLLKYTRTRPMRNAKILY